MRAYATCSKCMIKPAFARAGRRRSAQGRCGQASARDRNGAGEGNRTLVISLEGNRSKSRHKASSDKTPSIRDIELQRLFGAVRTRDDADLLPNIQAARDRDAAARARLRSGHSESEPEADFATCIRTAELSRHRGETAMSGPKWRCPERNARNLAEAIDELYRSTAAPRDHERLVDLVSHHVLHAYRVRSA